MVKRRVGKARSDYLLLDRQVAIAKADVNMMMRKKRIKMDDLKGTHAALEKADDVIQRNLKHGKYQTEKVRQRLQKRSLAFDRQESKRYDRWLKEMKSKKSKPKKKSKKKALAKTPRKKKRPGPIAMEPDPDATEDD